MAEDHDDDDHSHGNHTFVASPGRACLGFFLAFAAYWLSSFEYVENDPAELARQSARGRQVTWTTFDKEYTATPHAFLQPASREEVVSMVKDGARKNLSVKVVGSGHSWTPVGLAEGGVILNLDRMNKILRIDMDKMTVTAEAGIRIRDLSKALAAHDPPLSLVNTGVLDRQSLAGALSTGTHGSGINYTTMSNQIRAVELVTPTGDTVRASREETDPFLREVFEASTISLGALGVITALTVDVTPAFSVVRRNRLVPFEDAVEQLLTYAEWSHHVLGWWIPYTSIMQLYEANRTAHGEPPSDFREEHAITWRLLTPIKPFLARTQMRLLSAAGHVSSLLPAQWVPTLNRWLISPLFHVLAGGYVFIKQGHKGITLDSHPDRYRETEFFVPTSRFRTAFAELLGFMEAHKATLGANFIVQFRMTRSDNLWLSALRGPEPYYVAIALLTKGFDCEPYFKGASDIFLRHDGRPHWGKLHYLEYDELLQIYGEPFERFLAVRRALDPHDMFMNSYQQAQFLPRAVR